MKSCCKLKSLYNENIYVIYLYVVENNDVKLETNF